METGFGHDFSGVRLFGPDAGNQAARVGARAVTLGRDIFFAPGEYRREVLTHELAHVVQRDLGAPALAFRQDHGDLRRVERALRHAATTLSRSVHRVPTERMRELAESLATILSAFFPRGHGRMDEHGTVVADSQVVLMDQPVRHGSIRGTYRHEVRLFLSEERPSEAARYQPTATGGEIRIFVHNLDSMSESELIAALAHELVHMCSNILFRARQFGHRLRSTPEPLPGAEETGAHSGPAHIRLADATLGDSAGFDALLLALDTAYSPVVDYLNEQRALRGAPALDPIAVSATWAGRTADELLAYIVDEQVDIAVQLETGTGAGRVAFVIPLDPLRFFRSYVGLHWLTDPQDRAALQRPEANPILNRAGRSRQMQAVYDMIQQWVTNPAPWPAR